MSSQPNRNLMARVGRAVAAVLHREGQLTYPSVLVEMGVLTARDLHAWRAGHVPFLERVVRTNLTKLARLQTAVRRIARARGLVRHVQQVARGRRYSKTGHPSVEEEYRAAYHAPRVQPATAGGPERHAAKAR